jgi:predicted enzyme related to lactoylglutathione lyase
MKLRLVLVPIPVRDIDRATAFYADQLGFRIDHDVQPTKAVRVVHLTHGFRDPDGNTWTLQQTADGAPESD